MIQEAKNAVSAIKKKTLDEIRVLRNPPQAVKMTLECVTMLISMQIKQMEWPEIQGFMKGEGFISSIVNFDSKSVKRKVTKHIIATFLKSPDWNIEKIDRASKAAGPLAKWVESQLMYADILEQVDPLRNELEQLQKQEEDLQVQFSEIQEVISEMEKNIQTYKKEYALLISQVE